MVRIRGFGVCRSDISPKWQAQFGPGQSRLANCSPVQTPSAKYIHNRLSAYVQSIVTSRLPLTFVVNARRTK